MSYTEVEVIGRKDASVLVKWRNPTGLLRKTYLPATLVRENSALLEDLELGITHVSGFEEMLLETKFAQKAACLALTLEQAGIDTYKALQDAPRKVGHICGEDIYQVVAALNRVFNKGD